MVISKYFPTVAECTTRRPSGEDKIEIPADVYDIAVREGMMLSEDFIRGDYDYETVKILAQPGLIDALKFNILDGEIKTSSKVGISAEINFVLAIWNGYNREAAIERAILSGLKNSNIPKLLAEKVSQINISDGSNLEEDFAKHFVGKSMNYVEDKVQTAKAVSTQLSDNVPMIPRFFQKTGDLISAFGDEVIEALPHVETASDWVNGRISGKQALKNIALVFVGTAGAIAAISSAPVGGFLATLFVGFSGKMFFKEFYKPRLDAIFGDDDSKKLLEVFNAEFVKILNGKFLTQYETEIFLEAIGDVVTDKKLKDMYQYGNLSAQKKWAYDFIERFLQNIEGQRIFVITPTYAEWQAGLERVAELLNSGEDIAERMEQQRVQTLTQRCKFLAEKYDLKPYETAQAMSIINPMVKVKVGIGRTLAGMQIEEAHYQSEEQRIKNERVALKAKLSGRLTMKSQAKSEKDSPDFWR